MAASMVVLEELKAWAGTVRDNRANFRRDTRKTRVMRNPVGKACLTVCTTVRRAGRAGSQSVSV